MFAQETYYTPLSAEVAGIKTLQSANRQGGEEVGQVFVA